MTTIINLPDVELAKLFAITFIETDPVSAARFKELKAQVHQLYENLSVVGLSTPTI